LSSLKRKASKRSKREKEHAAMKSMET